LRDSNNKGRAPKCERHRKTPDRKNYQEEARVGRVKIMVNRGGVRKTGSKTVK